MNIVDEIPDVTEQGTLLPPIQDALQFFASDLEMPAVLVEGLLHMGSKLVIGGSSKSMKTWTLLDLALSVATGADWWGKKTTEGKVLYINFEIQPAFFRERIQAVLAARGRSLRPGEFDILNLRGFAADADQLIPQIIDLVRDKNYSLIVLDPIYKCLGTRDENKAGDIATMMNMFEQLAVRSGAAVAFSAHFSKGNQSAKESIDRIGGSGVFARDPDSIVVMTQHEQEDAFVVQTTLRNFPPLKPFCVRWKFPAMDVDKDLDPSKLKKPGNHGAKVEPHPDEMLMMFPKRWPRHNPRKGLLATNELEKVFAECGFSPETIPMVRAKLEKAGEIRVLTKQEGNRTLTGLPAAVTQYEEWKKRRGESTGGARRAKK